MLQRSALIQLEVRVVSAIFRFATPITFRCIFLNRPGGKVFFIPCNSQTIAIEMEGTSMINNKRLSTSSSI